MKIGTNIFAGETPKVSPRLLNDAQSQLAQNCDLQSGFLAPIKDKTEVQNIGKSNQESLFVWNYNTSEAIGHTVTRNNFSDWIGITDGSFMLSVAGKSYDITGINFSSVTSMNDVATIVQSAIRSVTGNQDEFIWHIDHFQIDCDNIAFVSLNALYEIGTDISGTDYLNMRGDIAVLNQDLVTTEHYSTFFNTPIIDDQYQRLYYLDTLTGDYRVRDNFYQFNQTDREMILDIPPMALTATASDPPLYGGQPASPATQPYSFSANSTYYQIMKKYYNSNDSNHNYYVYSDAVSLWSVNGTVEASEFKNGDAITVRYTVVKGWYDSSAGSNNIDSSTNYTRNTSIAGTSGNAFYLTSAIPSYSHNKYLSDTNDYVFIEIKGNNLATNATGTANVKQEGEIYPEIEGQPRAGDILDRYYVWSYVYDNGEESPISPVSNLAKIYPEAHADLTGIGTSTPPTGVVKKRIYTTFGDDFHFLADIDATSTTFTDDIANTGLGEALQVNNNPPPNMQGLALSSNGFVVGWRDNDLYFSESFMPYAFNDDFSLNVRYNIVSCIPVGTDIYVLTDGEPYILAGYSPDQLTLAELPIKQPCISPKAVTRIGDRVIYASPDGLISLAGGSSVILTENLLTRTQWQNIIGNDVILASHDDFIYVINENEMYLISSSNPNKFGVVRQDDITDATYDDVTADLIYSYNSDDQTVYSLRTSQDNKTYIWRSKEYDFKKRTHLSCGKIVADDYNDLTLNLYVDGDYTNPIATKPIKSKLAFRLPTTKSYNTLSYELVGTSVVHSVQLGTNMIELEG